MGKVVSKEEYSVIKSDLQKNNKKVILCHGVFDLVHPGHINHFKEAKSFGDVLVVSVTAARYVRKGPERPYFNDELRLEFLAAIEAIDYVLLSEGYTVDDIIKVVEPNLYVKGQEYIKAEDDVTGKIEEEAALVRSYGGDIAYTSGQVFSSTKLINVALSALTDEVKEYTRDFVKKYTLDNIKQYLKEIQKLKVLVVGDVIIDEYVFCDVQGLMSKNVAYSARLHRKEKYWGGGISSCKTYFGFL